MPLPNPEVYGTQETWTKCATFYAVGDGDSTTKTLAPRINVWDSASSDRRKGTLSRAITAGKAEAGTPIDPTICPCGQDPSVSCFGTIALFKNHGNADDNKVPDKVVSYDNPINCFFSELWRYTGGGRGFTPQRTDRSSNLCRWAPDGVLTNNTNQNRYVTPFVYYQLKSIFANIVVNTITGYDHLGRPNYAATSLENWKNNYQDRKINLAILQLKGVSSHTGGNIAYIGQNMDPDLSVGVSLLNDVDGITDYYTYYTDRKQEVRLFGDLSANAYNTTDSYYMLAYDMFENMEVKSVFEAGQTQGGWRVWQEVPYSEANYEKIMKMAACFGVPFSPTTKESFAKEFIDNDLYLPIIGSDGVTHGEYTHGAENIQNQLYNLNSIFDFEPMVPVPAERPKQINVYDINEPQNGFDHNGLAILMPIECISDKEELGRWDLTITHPIDGYGKWTYIVGQNVLKVNGQLFRIDETEIYQDADTASITAHAKHITYDLFDRFVDELTVENASGNEYIYKVIQRSQEILPTHRPEPNEYSFSISSNITGPVNIKVQDQTVIGALFGDDNSLAVRYGGRLSRDNFSMSINATQDNSPELPAFKLRFGTDLTKLSYKIDFSDWVTELICVDNFGNLWAVSYVGSEWIIHHQKTRRIHFTYDPDTPDPMGCLEKDGYAYWLTVSTPTVSIEVGIAALKNDPKYKDFVDLQNLDVGCTGSVYIEQYNIDVNMKIVSIRRNELTGEAIQVVLGTARGSLIRSPVCSQTIVPNGSVEAKQAQTIKDMQTEIENVKLKSMKYWNGMKNYTWADVKKYKWEEIKNGELNN